MYRFLLRPIWLLSHLFVVAVLVVFVNLGIWQLRRLEERRDVNDRLLERIDAEPASIDDLVVAGSDEAAVDGAEYRPVVATGTWAAADQVLVANRSLDGAPGYWVVTPLDLGDGTGVAVVRGWVRYDVTDLDGAGREYPPPEGEVTVSGLVRASQEREGIGAGEPDGRLTTLKRLDVARLDEQTDLSLLPVYVDLQTSDPPVEEPPRPLPAPEPGEGPHLSYAVQWFLFTAVVAIGYPLALRRIAHQRAGSGDPGADVADPDDPRPGPEPTGSGGAADGAVAGAGAR